MRSARDRTRSRGGSQESRPTLSRRGSITDDTVSPPLSFSDGLEAFICGRRSRSNSQPGTPVIPGTPTAARSFSFSSDDGEPLLPTVSRLAFSKHPSPEKSGKSESSSLQDRKSHIWQSLAIPALLHIIITEPTSTSLGRNRLICVAGCGLCLMQHCNRTKRRSF